MASQEGFSQQTRRPNPVRDRRRALGLTVADLQRLTGLSDVTIWRVESGRGRCQWGTAVLLAYALGLSPDEVRR